MRYAAVLKNIFFRNNVTGKLKAGKFLGGDVDIVGIMTNYPI